MATVARIGCLPTLLLLLCVPCGAIAVVAHCRRGEAATYGGVSGATEGRADAMGVAVDGCRRADSRGGLPSLLLHVPRGASAVVARSCRGEAATHGGAGGAAEGRAGTADGKGATERRSAS
jgi:hypothetical protein